MADDEGQKQRTRAGNIYFAQNVLTRGWTVIIGKGAMAWHQIKKTECM
jgi:hypothetical protein